MYLLIEDVYECRVAVNLRRASLASSITCTSGEDAIEPTLKILTPLLQKHGCYL